MTERVEGEKRKIKGALFRLEKLMLSTVTSYWDYKLLNSNAKPLL